MDGTREDELGVLLQGGVWLTEYKGETRNQEGWWEENHWRKGCENWIRDGSKCRIVKMQLSRAVQAWEL